MALLPLSFAFLLLAVSAASPNEFTSCKSTSVVTCAGPKLAQLTNDGSCAAQQDYYKVVAQCAKPSDGDLNNEWCKAVVREACLLDQGRLNDGGDVTNNTNCDLGCSR